MPTNHASEKRLLALEIWKLICHKRRFVMLMAYSKCFFFTDKKKLI